MLLSLFLTGIFLGYGPCLLSCGPLLVSYIAATKENALGGLKTYIIFSLTRMFVYIVFGILAGLLGEWVIHRFFESQALKILFFAFGLFLTVLGILLIIEKFSLGQKCHSLIHHYLGSKDLKNIIIFGLILSFAPCLPLMAVLGYIVLISDHWLKGVLYMSAFGLGTVISPLIVFSMAAGWLAKVLTRHEKAFRILKVFCGLIIVYLGISLMLSIQNMFLNEPFSR